MRTTPDGGACARELRLHPIGVFRCEADHSYDVARQGVLSDNMGEVRLEAGCGFEQALRDLEGFSHVWLIFWFDRNEHWKPVVSPPRGTRRVGVFASRSPHRPNPLGMSLVRLVRIAGLTLQVRGYDLLDGTPVLDIKPYLDYADRAPGATSGWLDEVADETPWRVVIGEEAQAALTWLAQQGLATLEGFLRRELAWRPTDGVRKRVRALPPDDVWEIAYRTWRADFVVDESARTARILRIRSGYETADLAPDRPDRYGDFALHRAFRQQFP